MDKKSTVLNKENVLEKVCKRSGIELQVRDLLTLNPMEKLNGEVIVFCKGNSFNCRNRSGHIFDVI